MSEEKTIEKKELDFFTIGTSFGGNQNWLKDKTMYYGGCAAVTATEAVIYYHNQGKYVPHLFLNTNLKEVEELNVAQFISLTEIMKPYLRPRISGIHKLSTYVEGLRSFIESHRVENLFVREFSGEHTHADAKRMIETQIQAGHPIPFLLLLHKNPEFKHLTWHWFLILGFRNLEDGFWVKVGTYGKARWYLLHSLWVQGIKKKVV